MTQRREQTHTERYRTNICAVVLMLLMTTTPMSVSAEENARNKPNIAPQPHVAVLGFWLEAGRHASAGQILPQLISTDLVESGRVVVLERGQASTVWQEAHLRESDLIDTENPPEPAAALGADLCISGRYSILPEESWINCTLRDMRQQSTETIIRVERHDDDLFALSNELTAKLLSIIDEPVNRQPPAPAPLKVFEQNYTLALFDFKGYGGNNRSLIASALGDIFVQDLQDTGPFILVDREHLARIIEEQALSKSGVVSMASTLQAARLVGADFLLLGSLVQHNERVRLSARMIDATSGTVLLAAHVSGDSAHITHLPRQLYMQFKDSMGITLNPPQKSHMERPRYNVAEAMIQIQRAKGSAERVFDLRDAAQTLEYAKAAALLDPESAMVHIECSRICDQFVHQFGSEEAGHLLAERKSHLRKALALNPHDPDALLENSKLAMEERHIERAIELAKNTLTVSPRNAAAHGLIASAYLNREERDIAEEHLKTALELTHNNYPWASMNLADLYEKAGRHEEAATQYSQMFDLKMAVGWEMIAWCQIKSADNYMKAGQLDRAESALRNAAERYSAMPVLHCMLGEVLLEMGRKDEAIRHFYDELQFSTHGIAAERATAALIKLGLDPSTPSPMEQTVPVFDAAHVDGHILLWYTEDFTEVDLLPTMQKRLESIMGLRVKVEPGPALPEEMYDENRGQYGAESEKLRTLVQNLYNAQPETLAVVVLCSKDLYNTPMVRFVYGNRYYRSSYSQRFAMYSTFRLDPRNFDDNNQTDEQAKRELLTTYPKLILKAAAWGLGRNQCQTLFCPVSGISGGHDMERNRTTLCPDCVAKLRDLHPFWPQGLCPSARRETAPETKPTTTSNKQAQDDIDNYPKRFHHMEQGWRN